MAGLAATTIGRAPVAIAVDAMSGDRGPATTVPAVLEALRRHPALQVLLVGRADELRPACRRAPADRLRLVDAPEVVAMDEPPHEALRRRKRSSMRLTLDLVKEGAAAAAVSAGNTGALVATARFVLRTLPGIDRPAIVSTIPARGGHTCMLDLGANARCTAEQLVQFAVMGTVIAADLHAIRSPRVGLLNIGEEDIKGTETVRKAGRLLASTDLNYVGFVEGGDVFSGRVDVVVTDGFTGNVALKTMEGSISHVAGLIEEEFGRGWRRRLMGLAARPVLSALRRRLDPRRYNGASLVGLRGVVIKSHGDADRVAFLNALQTAMVEAQQDVPSQIGGRLRTLRPRLEAV